MRTSNEIVTERKIFETDTEWDKRGEKKLEMGQEAIFVQSCMYT